ncbi:MAG: ribosome small subunit-dependent GTPase A [Fibrobacter sp.]|nr:ribosome small subunit-dependent GTPase A [Fibrobacter sp.]
MQLSGRVIEEQKNYLIVDTPEGTVRSTIKGILKKNKTRVFTGDLVDLEIINRDPLEGVISAIHERSSLLKRPAVANLSQVFFIFTVKSPPLDLESLDRFLFSARVYGLEAIIVFNKIDLLNCDDSKELEKIREIYRKIGYRTVCTSAVTNTGIEELISLCKDKISAFSGLSGAGKSTLLSKIILDKSFRIGEVSGSNGRGTHTTTHVSLHPLKEGGYVADTPGISFVNVPTVPEEEVTGYFPELECRIGQCRYNNCIHGGEPGCIVDQLIAENEIAGFRRDHYLKIYNEMKAIRKRYK